MNYFDESPGFLDFLAEVPLFFKLFGGALILLVVSVFAYVIIKGFKSWFSNNAAELVRKSARVVDKRTEVWGGSGDSSANTNYFITFEFNDHTRIELHVAANHFGLIVVGDDGELTYQGTRFKGFTRLTDDEKNRVMQ
ncbi:hypothetical protein FHS15_004080 [Paenibacillus castaneae]|uniref:DUF2500 domain-containing protein n=1 Tax=Paenibacillus castaneae TaxID=474957 RepID=UPI000C9D083F|nr:DUF2500 domain-containing protein [Paenibacillus castaneae]NIK78934.1 hypothetical protein [Paenibacillus castaneae]